jgi:hypothetical protein
MENLWKTSSIPCTCSSRTPASPGRRRRAGPGHRRQHRHLHRRQCGAAQAAHLSRRRPHRAVSRAVARWPTGSGASIPGVSLLTGAADQRLSGRGRLRLRRARLQPHRRPPGAGPRHSRHRGLLPPLRRAGHAGPHLHAAGRLAQRRQSGGAQLRGCGSASSAAIPIVGSALAGQRAVHHRRRARQRFSSPIPQADIWLPFQFDPNSTNQGHYFEVPPDAQARRNAGPGQRADEARRPPSSTAIPRTHRMASRAFAVSPARQHRRRRAQLAARSCSAPSAWSCSSPAPTWPTCCWSAPRAASASSPSAPLWGAGAAHHPPTAHRKRAALRHRRRSRPGARLLGVRACWPSAPPDCRASAKTARPSASTGACSPSRSRLAAHRHSLRTVPRLQRLAHRPQLDAEGEQQPLRHRIPPEQSPLLLVISEVSLALVLLVGAALLIRTFSPCAPSIPASTRTTSSPWRCRSPATATRRPPASASSARWPRAAQCHPRRGGLGLHLLPAARRRLRAALHDRRPPARRKSQERRKQDG